MAFVTTASGHLAQSHTTLGLWPYYHFAIVNYNSRVVIYAIFLSPRHYSRILSLQSVYKIGTEVDVSKQYLNRNIHDILVYSTIGPSNSRLKANCIQNCIVCLVNFSLAKLCQIFVVQTRQRISALLNVSKRVYPI